MALNSPIPISVQLSQIERAILCTEIIRFSLLLAQEARGRSGESLAAVPDSQSEGSPAERLSLLAKLWPRLDAALGAIVTSPDSASVALPRSLPIHTVRGHPSTLARLARNPADHRAWTQTTQEEEAIEPARIQEQRPTHTVQTAANRIAAEFLETLAQEIQALHRLALFCEEATAVATAAELSQHVARRRRLSPFQECTASPGSGPPVPPETLLRCPPAYRSLYAVILQSRSGLQVDWSESALLRFPVLEAWHLYEIWCFLRVGIALRDLGWQVAEADCLQIVPTGMRLRLAHGNASRIRFRPSHFAAASAQPDTLLELLYQPLFASANRRTAQSSAGFRSLSHVMQPDIALVRNGRLLLLDPKYRSYSEIGAEQEDVDKMHAYRDAIVRTDENTGQTLPAVDAAWCLFPGMPDTPNSPPEPLRAYPASTLEQPFGTAGVGAVRVRPFAANTEITALLRHWLEAAS